VGEARGHGVRLRTYAWSSPGRPRALLLRSLAAHGHRGNWVAPRLTARFDVWSDPAIFRVQSKSGSISTEHKETT
jgi:hypothetical protein